MAEVRLTAAAARDIERLPLVVHARVLALFERLARWPEVSGARALRGLLAGRWRIRTGAYRVQFRIEKGLVIVERIGHRRDVYD